MAVINPAPADRYMMTEFDPKSVMLYYFPPEYFKDGKASKCYIPTENNDISELDRVTVDFMYPPNAAARLKNFAAAKADYVEAVERSKNDGSKSIGIDFVEVYFDRDWNAADGD